MQSGSNDCGLFAVAFATVEEDPTNLFFDQETMRGHLFKCGFFVSFPRKKEPGPTKAIREIIDIYCNCRMPELKKC